MSTVLKKSYKPLIYALAIITPSVTFAAARDISPLRDFINQITTFLNSTIMPFLMVVATVIFVYGMIMYIRSAGEEQEKMRNLMLWSIIALAVILSLWSLVGILSKFFGTAVINPGPTT